ncbi:MAG TPA: YicC family protein [Chromatiales bacterium]|nr:YicC family protein [Chromatiales bacterium]
MIRSMTGYARREERSDLGLLVCELRSVNHRYLEVYFRMPEELRSLEPELRKRAGERLGRGKLECHFTFRPGPAMLAQVVVNEALVDAVLEAVRSVEHRMSNPARIDALSVLSWPGATLDPEIDPGPVQEQARRLFGAALEDLVAARQREGERLQAFLTQRCAAIEELVKRVRERRAEVLSAVRERWEARLRELDVQVDPARLEQELAIAAQRLDVDEELDRLVSHCAEFRAILERREPVGRRMDFLMQEFNREANTLASKAADIETTQAAVELKVLIEQMREQVQNIE